jgi:hypothetical protein
MGWVVNALADLPPGKRPDTHCIGGWVGPRAGLDECRKSVQTEVLAEKLAPVSVYHKFHLE